MCRRRTNLTFYLGFWIPAFLCLVVFFGQVRGQYAKVQQATAETSDGLRFIARLKQQNVPLRQNVTIDYEIQNGSKKTIYLVQRDGKPQISRDGDNVNLPFVIVSSGDSDAYHYSFTKIPRGTKKRGQLLIPADKFDREQTWVVNISFGFVSNVNGLDRKLRPKEDPAPFRGLLEERILLVGVNGLIVEVGQP